MKYKLKDIGTITTGKTPSKKIVGAYGKKINFLTPRDLNGQRYSEYTERRLSLKGIECLKNYEVIPPSISVSCIGSDMGKVVFNKTPIVTNQQLNSISNIRKDIDPLYLYYLLYNKRILLKFMGSDRGSTMPILSKREFGNLEFEFPNLKTQKSISSRLDSLDKKIEVNSRINDNLLELAKAKFNQTYILPTNGFQKVPLGWERSKLDKIITFSNGYNFKRSDMLKAPEPLTYRIFKQGNILIGGGLNDFGTKSWILKSKVKNLDRFVLKKWDLLMAMTDMKNKVAILGNTALMNRNNQYILNQRVGLIRSNNYNNISQIYLFLLTNSKSFLYNIRSKAHSGVQVNLSTKDIKKINLIIAPEEVNNNFNRFAKPIFEKMMENQVDNLTLNEIKQALLNNFF